MLLIFRYSTIDWTMSKKFQILTCGSKANPNLGKTVSYETYILDVERAEKAPSVRNDILAKRFGIPMEGYTYYFTYDETLPHRKRDFLESTMCDGRRPFTGR